MRPDNEPIAPGSEERIDVWIVDDNAFFRDTMAELLDASSGFRCAVSVNSCEAALDALQRDLLPEIILMDIGLPGGMGGIDGVRHVKAIAPAVHVVMLTVHHDEQQIFDAICAGASGYLLKTTPSEEIVDSLSGIRVGGAPIDARIARCVLDMFSRLAAPRTDYGISDREREILEHLVEGRTKRTIGDLLFLSPHTVDGHVRNIYAKLQVHTRSGAVAKAVREKLI